MDGTEHCQHCTQSGRQRVYNGIVVWLCQQHWEEMVRELARR